MVEGTVHDKFGIDTTVDAAVDVPLYRSVGDGDGDGDAGKGYLLEHDAILVEAVSDLLLLKDILKGEYLIWTRRVAIGARYCDFDSTAKARQ